jgi:hypothetical protein
MQNTPNLTSAVLPEAGMIEILNTLKGYGIKY